MTFHIGYWLHHYGYGGIFAILLMEMIGFPFPAETTLMVSGVAMGTHQFAAFPLLLSAIAGNVLGSTLAYWIGRIFGRSLILRFGKFVKITPEKFAKAERMFNRNRIYILLLGKFIAGIRVLIPYLAGINKVSFVSFSLYNSLSAIVWVVLFVFFGRFMQGTWHRYGHHLIHHIWYLVSGAVLLLSLVIWLTLRKRRSVREAEPEPESGSGA